MNRFIKFLLGTKPEAGVYYSDTCRQRELVLTEEQIGRKYVQLNFGGQDPALLTFRSFHEGYTRHKIVFE